MSAPATFVREKRFVAESKQEIIRTYVHTSIEAFNNASPSAVHVHVSCSRVAVSSRVRVGFTFLSDDNFRAMSTILGMG